MLFEFGFYSSLLLITFSQGIIYSILLLIKAIKTENKSNYWLSLFIFLCSLYVAPWMLGFAGWYDNLPYRDILFYVPFLHLFLIGPAIYFYTQSLLNPGFKFTKKHWLHLIPGILYLLYSLIIWITDKLILNEYYFYEDQTDKDFALWYFVLGFISMTIYFILSLKYYKLYQKIIVQIVSYADLVLFKWIKNYLYAFLLCFFYNLFIEFYHYFLNKQEHTWEFGGTIYFFQLHYFILL
jgi:hypothetical protein